MAETTGRPKKDMSKALAAMAEKRRREKELRELEDKEKEENSKQKQPEQEVQEKMNEEEERVDEKEEERVEERVEEKKVHFGTKETRFFSPEISHFLNRKIVLPQVPMQTRKVQPITIDHFIQMNNKKRKRQEEEEEEDGDESNQEEEDYSPVKHFPRRTIQPLSIQKKGGMNNTPKTMNNLQKNINNEKNTQQVGGFSQFLPKMPSIVNNIGNFVPDSVRDNVYSSFTRMGGIMLFYFIGQFFKLYSQEAEKNRLRGNNNNIPIGNIESVPAPSVSNKRAQYTNQENFDEFLK